MAQTQLVKEAFKKWGFGGPRPKSQFDTLEVDPRFKERVDEATEAAQAAELAASIEAAFAAAEKVEMCNAEGGFQRYEAVRLGGFEQ